MLRRRNKKYSKELKIKAVEKFLVGNGSQRKICRKYEISSDKQLREWIKLYLSAILDLYDKRIVSYQIGAGNNNPLVFDTLNDAVKENTKAHPLFHSD
ncbi:MAG: transposase, partial [Oscillospiraceae bacterium]